MKKLFYLNLFVFFISITSFSQNSVETQLNNKDFVEIKKEEPSKKKWFDLINIRGYAQVRYNKLLEILQIFDQTEGDKIKAIKEHQFSIFAK